MTAELLCMAVLALGMPRADFACDHMSEVVEASKKHNLDPTVLVALIRVESRWNHRAVSRAGACGLTQVLPRYTRKPRLSCRKLKNPKTSIFTGAKTLRRWIKRYGRGNVKKGLCGYNAGYRCRRWNRGWRYATRVLRYAKRIRTEMKKIKKAGYPLPGPNCYPNKGSRDCLEGDGC